MMNLYDEILRLPRNHRVALTRWLCGTLRLGRKEWQHVMGVSRTTLYKRRKA